MRRAASDSARAWWLSRDTDRSSRLGRPTLSRALKGYIDVSESEQEPTWLLLNLADQEFTCVGRPTRKEIRTSLGAETSPLLMAPPTR